MRRVSKNEWELSLTEEITAHKIARRLQPSENISIIVEPLALKDKKNTLKINGHILNINAATVSHGKIRLMKIPVAVFRPPANLLQEQAC